MDARHEYFRKDLDWTVDSTKFLSGRTRGINMLNRRRRQNTPLKDPKNLDFSRKISKNLEISKNLCAATRPPLK